MYKIELNEGMANLTSLKEALEYLRYFGYNEPARISAGIYEVSEIGRNLSTVSLIKE